MGNIIFGKRVRDFLFAKYAKIKTLKTIQDSRGELCSPAPTSASHYLTPKITDTFSFLPSDVFTTPLTKYVPSDT